MPQHQACRSIYLKLCAIFNWVASQAGKPPVILWVIFICSTAFTWLPVDPTNATVSVVSLVLSLMILGKQERDEVRSKKRDEAMHVKLNALAKATEGVDDAVEGLEDKTEAEIDKVKQQL